MTAPTIQTTTRNATLPDLVSLLRDHHARRVDVVAPARSIRARGGNLHIIGTEPQLGPDGVTMADGIYQPTRICDDGISQKLGIPRAYLGRMRTENPDLFDTNVNSWLEHEKYSDKKYLVRCLRGDDDVFGVARAFLSDVYKTIDNLDVLMATLDGVRDAGVEVDIRGCDLSDTRMYVRIFAPQVGALAPTLLAGYNNPFRGGGEFRFGHTSQGWDVARATAVALAEGMGYEPGTEPVLFAGFRIENSELGIGAFRITPELVVQICKNGLTIKAEALKSQHLGAKLDEGVVRWSADTTDKALALVTAQTRDAVKLFLSPEYVGAKIRELERAADVEVDDPVETVEFVAKKLKYGEKQQADILRHFVKGSQLTAGGIMQAVSSVAQTVQDADLAAQMEEDAIGAMMLVASR